MRAFIHENEPYRIELLGNWPSFLKNILEKAASVTLEEVNVLACLVTHMDSSQIETYEAAIQMRQEENIDVLVGIKELLNLCYNLECFKFLRGIIDDRKLGEFYLEEDRLEWIHTPGKHRPAKPFGKSGLNTFGKGGRKNGAGFLKVAGFWRK